MSSKVQPFFFKNKTKNREYFFSYLLDDIPRTLEYKNFKHKNDRMLTC